MSLAQEFTDDVYLSFEELETLLNYQNTQAVWNEIQVYRKPFQWQLNASAGCFTCTLTPTFLAQCYELEQQLRFYQLLSMQQQSSEYMLQAALNPQAECAFYLNNLKAYYPQLSYEQVAKLTQAHVFVQVMAARYFIKTEIEEVAAFCLTRYGLVSALDFLELTPCTSSDVSAKFKSMIMLARQKLKNKLRLLKLQDMMIDTQHVEDLCERYPFLSDSQVRFYCTHRQPMHYYTVNDYAKWNACSIETARTSLNELVQLGWYKKQKVGKKFVYLI